MNQSPEILKIPDARVRLPLLIQVTGHSKATIYRLIERGEFPKPTKLGPKCSVWPAKVVTNYLRGDYNAELTGAQRPQENER